MARYVSHRKQVETAIRDEFVSKLSRIGEAGLAHAQQHTEEDFYDTGYALRSLHTVTTDERGMVVSSSGVDGNGSALPSYPATGELTMNVGSNTAPKDGRGYFVGGEVGEAGQAGRAMLSHAFDDTEAAIEGIIRGKS